MKTASTFLYDLVHSLTKSEKRYIKVQAGPGEKDYIQLMDALIKQPAFDEAALIKAHAGAKFLKHLSVNKRYLYEQILKSLTNFGEKKLEHKVFEKVMATNSLIGKGLFTAALSELRKGQKIVAAYELFDFQIMFCSIEKRLLARQQIKKKNDQDIQRIYEVEIHCLEQIKNTNDYWYLVQQIAQFQMSFQKIQNQAQQKHIDELTASPLFQDISLATNIKSKLYFYQANATFQFILGNVEEAYQINKRFLELLESNPQFLKLYAERYLATLNNMLIDTLIIGKFDILEEGIERLAMTLQRPEFNKIKNIESRVFRQRYLLLINWSLSQQDFKKAMDWIPEIETGLQAYGKKIERHHRITFYYLVAYLLFNNKQYAQALKWNNLIINDPKEDVVKEIFYFARILNLLIHFELGNHTLLESLLLSTPKYLKSRRAIYATEKALFRFLKKRLNCIDKAVERKLVVNFRAQLEELFEVAREKRIFGYLDFRLWIGNSIRKR